MRWLWLGRNRVNQWLLGKRSAASLLGVKDSARKDLLWHAFRHHEEGRVNEAARIYQLVCDLWPESPDGLNGLGVIHLESGRLMEAQKAFESALAITPNDPFALANLAECQLLQGKSFEARAKTAQARAALAGRKSSDELRTRIDKLDELSLVNR
jgi:Flp pilus assembly protein TadD